MKKNDRLQELLERIMVQTGDTGAMIADAASQPLAALLIRRLHAIRKNADAALEMAQKGKPYQKNKGAQENARLAGR